MRTLRTWTYWAAALAAACSSDSSTPFSGLEGNPVIDSIVPAAGIRGKTLDIHVLGAGFDDGSEVHFERGGTPTDDIETNSTQFVNSQELIASVTIDTQAQTGPYSLVVVTQTRKRGIGLEDFLALDVVGTLLGGVSSIANDVNENGEVVGFGQIGFCPGDPCDPHHALYWFEGVLEDVGIGVAFAINGGCAVGSCRLVGQRDDRPVVWQKQGGIWTSFELPTESGQGWASAINDRGDQIAGSMVLGGGLVTAVVWTESASGWTATELPPADNGYANAINDVGQVAGHAAGRAIVWTSGGGGWTPQELQPLPGDIEARAPGINNAGDVVGESGSGLFGGGSATLWRRTLAGWAPPIVLVPEELAGVTRSSASDINDKGAIVGTIEHEELDFGLRQEAFLWTEDIGFVGLGIFEGRGTVARAVSENNQIAGSNTLVALLWRISLD
jgi:uncharacterized membrane protein